MKRFTLHYRGELKSNGDAAHKHRIRSCFHDQLERKYAFSGHLQAMAKVESDPVEYLCERYSIARASQFWFAHVSSSPVELDIVMLRTGTVGEILGGGGDIDNRLKTLFDALQVPDENQIRAVHGPFHRPFHCAIADDALVSRIGVRVAQLLDVPPESREVVVTVDVAADATTLPI